MPDSNRKKQANGGSDLIAVPAASGCIPLNRAISAPLPEVPAIPYPGSHCPFFGVVNMMPPIKNAYAILIGPSVCLYNAKIADDLKAFSAGHFRDAWSPLNLTHEDIVFGIHEKVKKAVRRVVSSHRIDVLFLVTTCVTEITGEDIDAIAAELRRETRTKLLVIHTDHFAGTDHGQGIERIYLSLAELMKPQSVDPKVVNLLGLRSAETKKTELAAVLEKNGFRIQAIIPSACSAKDIARAPAATLNIVLEQPAMTLAQTMQSRFGTGFIDANRPFAIDSIAKWYDAIGEILAVDLENDLAPLKKNAVDAIERFRHESSGQSCILYAVDLRIGRPFDLARLLVSLGMRLLAVVVKEPLGVHREDIRSTLEDGINPMVCMQLDGLKQYSYLNDFAPDLLIGGVYNEQDAHVRRNIQHRDLQASYFVLGYERIGAILEALIRHPAGWEIRRYRQRLMTEAEEG